MLRVRVLNQQEQIEKRLKFLCDLKEASAVYPMSKRGKVEDVAEGQKLLRKSMTILNNHAERLHNVKPELPLRTLENPFKRSSTILMDSPAPSETRRSTLLPSLNFNLSPFLDSPSDQLLKRCKSSVGNKKNELNIFVSITETSEENNEKMNFLRMPESKPNSTRCLSQMSFSSILPQQLENAKTISHSRNTRSELITPRLSKEKLPVTPKHKSPCTSKFQKKRNGISVYPMNSFPVYLALWSPELKFL